MDILCHALESYTARWYTSAQRKSPEQRVPPPRPVTGDDLGRIFKRSLELW